MSYTAAQITDAFSIPASTAREWLNVGDIGLKVRADEERTGGWRRFDLSDAIRFFIVTELMKRHKVDSWAAIAAVNSIYDLISKKVPELYHDLLESGVSFAERRPCYVVFFRLTDAPHEHRVLESYEALVDAARNGSLSGTIVIDLGGATVSTASRLSRITD